MKPSGIQLLHASARQMATLAAVIAVLAFAPGTAMAAEKDAHQDRAELRVTDLHAKLKITSAQEAQWAKVAQVMRDNAKAMDTLTQARIGHAKDMTAVDDLKSYGEIADTHADGIKKLTAEFSPLYDSMSDSQKKEADSLFRHGDRKHAHKMASGK